MGGDRDGNWAGIFLENMQGAVIENSFIHDIAVPSGGGQQSSGGCMKLYHNADSIVQNNTCRTVNIPDSQAGGIDDKAQATRNIHRYNWIQDVNTCVRINNQLQSIGRPDLRQHLHRPLRHTAAGVRLITNINGITIYNNTFYRFGVGLMIMRKAAASRTSATTTTSSPTSTPTTSRIEYRAR